MNDNVHYHSLLGLTSIPGLDFWTFAGVKGIYRQESIGTLA